MLSLRCIIACPGFPSKSHTFSAGQGGYVTLHLPWSVYRALGHSCEANLAQHPTTWVRVTTLICRSKHYTGISLSPTTYFWMLILPIFDLFLPAIPRSISPLNVSILPYHQWHHLIDSHLFSSSFYQIPATCKIKPLSDTIPIPFPRLHKMPPALKEKAMSSFLWIDGAPMFQLLSLSQLPSPVEHWGILDLEGNLTASRSASY